MIRLEFLGDFDKKIALASDVNLFPTKNFA